MYILLFHLFYFACINLLVLLLGYLIIKKRLIAASWFMFVFAILTVHLLFMHDHPIIRMLAIIATTFTAMKVIAVAESYKHQKLNLSFKQWLAFAGGWAGMRAQPFETLGQAALPNAWPLVWQGVSRVIAGALFILLAHLLLHFSHSTATIILVSAILLIGLSLILHFGMLSISAGMWRFSGANTYLLFRQPAKAISLTEFWSKRWNIAFSEMTSVAIFRPLKAKTGSPVALLLAFAFSGLLHELALSVPVNSGYGLPMLYFIIQGALVLFEKFLTIRKNTFLQHKVVAKIWLFFWLVVPAPLLFHPQFIKQIVWPLAGLHYNF
ncbi:MBOAT family protein [Mucilaginibacter jinjuensis]|uniref:MBOAT family protein n=1 Tax=Mucilaginibacter jinjuensis TaxID=1176721 RepID=A0ABY7T670_9SPHI|nr:MBOAT family protein [Mucilaginibacter jinjuensis]WCT11763.1 MBOAT family protein [Mucilaginibacter jinjuensis]